MYCRTRTAVTAVAGVALALTAFAPAAPASATVSVSAPESRAAADPVPGRFCKTADLGKKVKTSKYGLVVCKKVKGRARWV